MNEKLTKKEIIAKLAEMIDTSQQTAETMLNALTSLIISQLQIGREITLPGLGTFVKQHKPERIGINPTTKQKIKIPGKNVPKFKPAKNLKDAVGLTE